MDLVRPDFQRNHFGSILRSSLMYQLKKAFGDLIHENFTTIFWTPNDVIFTAVHDIVSQPSLGRVYIFAFSAFSLSKITRSLISTCLKAGALRLRLVEILLGLGQKAQTAMADSL
jgi:hypothetical protein